MGYARRHLPENCDHVPEDHVVYDHRSDDYRGRLRCSCGSVEVTHQVRRASHAEAATDAQAMLTQVLRPTANSELQSH